MSTANRIPIAIPLSYKDIQIVHYFFPLNMCLILGCYKAKVGVGKSRTLPGMDVTRSRKYLNERSWQRMTTTPGSHFLHFTKPRRENKLFHGTYYVGSTQIYVVRCNLLL